jgi:sugar phosphate permease
MGQAAKPIKDELGLTNTEIGYVLMAFTVAYGLFEVPTGRLGDRFGSRNVLTRIVVWWSVFTALTGASTGLAMLLVVRFLFGVGEAGAYPNVARVLSRWIPLAERGRVQGALLAAAQVGAVLAPALAAQLIAAIGWRWAFAVFGSLGVVWAVGFWLWFRDDPAAHPGVNTAELADIRSGMAPPVKDPGPVPWRAVLWNRGVLMLSLVTVCGAFNTYFYYSWFPTYLKEARGLGETDAGWFASFVQVGSTLGLVAGGLFSDRITRFSADPIRSRRFLGVAAFLTATGFLIVGARCDKPTWLAVFFALSSGSMLVYLPNWWSVAIPQGGRHVGTVFGLMNGIGAIGAIASQWSVGAFADWQKSRGLSGREQWDPLYSVYAAVLVSGAVAWLLYRMRPLPEPAD